MKSSVLIDEDARSANQTKYFLRVSYVRGNESLIQGDDFSRRSAQPTHRGMRRADNMSAPSIA